MIELVVKNAKLRNKSDLFDIAIDKGIIVDIQPHLEYSANQEINANGNLTIPAFIDPHLHLDKANAGDSVKSNITGTLREAIDVMHEEKKRCSKEDIIMRAREVVEMAILNGITRIRTHVDIDTISRLKSLLSILKLRSLYSSIMDIQIVAFPQEGILRDPGSNFLLREAMRQGANIVGGIPAIENSTNDCKDHIKTIFDIAEEFDADIDIHVDESDDPLSKTLEMIANETIIRHYYGRVTADHVCALAAYDDYYAEYVMEKVKLANIHIITLPATNLMLQGRSDKHPKRRGVTRIKELIEKGINVSFGQDNINDPFYPFGSVNPLQIALITAHAAHMSSPSDIDKLLDMPTYNAAKILALRDYGIEIGKRADIIVIDAKDIKSAIRLTSPCLFVIRKGKLVARTRVISEIIC